MTRVKQSEQKKGISMSNESAIEDIVIDSQFRELLRPLTEDEYAALEESIRAEGCRDALVVWPCDEGRVLLDGHNRKEICDRLGINYGVVELQLNSRKEAEDWIIRNLLGRRNLHSDCAKRFRTRRENGLNKQQVRRIESTYWHKIYLPEREDYDPNKNPFDGPNITEPKRVREKNWHHSEPIPEFTNLYILKPHIEEARALCAFKLDEQLLHDFLTRTGNRNTRFIRLDENSIGLVHLQGMEEEE